MSDIDTTATESPISMSSPDISEEEVELVSQVLRSGRLALGPWADEFEARMCAYVGCRHAVSVNSGTAALHLIVRSLQLGPGDEVLVPSFTFVASVNAILYERAKPVFVDIEPVTYNLDPEDVERKITKRTKAVMVVDAFGHPAAWDRLLEIAERHNLLMIDDACEALGSEFQGRRVGGFGNAASFAFYPNKQVTTGEGGMLVTNDEHMATLARKLRNQGRAAMGAWLHHEVLGFNYRMDEMSAAIGALQLARLDQFLAKREQVAAAYSERLAGRDWVRPPVVLPEVRMSWFVYVVTLAPGIFRDKVMNAMLEHRIPAHGYFSPVHLQPYAREMLGTGEGLLPVTEDMASRTLALPFYNNLSPEQIDRVVEALDWAAHEV